MGLIALLILMMGLFGCNGKTVNIDFPFEALGTDTFGNITRLDNALEGLPKRLEMNEMELDNLKKQFETAKVDVERPFPQEEELKAKTDRLNELNALDRKSVV